LTKTTTIADVEELEWRLDSYDPIKLPAFRGSTLSLAAAGELLCLLRQYNATGLRANLKTLFASCPVWTLARKLEEFPRAKRLSDGAVVFVRIPPSYDEGWYVEEMRQFRAILLSHRFPHKLSAGLTGGVFEIVDSRS
jgi:hypothetical protein